jgi:phage shock protein PspC (stress-responsive transcriptional regulator)
MSQRPRRGRLDGMEQHTDIPTGTTSAGPAATSSTGTPGSFGVTDAAANGAFDPPRAALPPAPAPRFTLRRSRTDRMLGGVLGGVAASLDADPALLRVLTVALTLITGGAAAIVYAAAWALAPQEELQGP